ncbi:glycosyltransferase family 8 protein [Aerococcus loyolae]|uniref:glycosyltransferase family 8 protein n=1 Tax=Aerococcus loyolae TaxID=2976809 RepID=UPI0012447236|nr:glycosyltransferase family 8 protein [Aerococcus loyolae]KAA9266009.1 glycosyltransferase family 8 protein [Aerococcus loyolae]
MNLLFAVDDHYVEPMLTTLYSIYKNTAKRDYQVYILQKQSLAAHDIIDRFLQAMGMTYHPVLIDPDIFQEAPVSKRYPETIYYRLLAHYFLPDQLEKILYLDADILCINDLVPLYETDLGDDLYGAASHAKLTKITDQINKLRLGNSQADHYYNSGVLLMNLKAIRQKVKADDIFSFIRENRLQLILPDQDVLNALYSQFIFDLPDQVYNYDVRYSKLYELISEGKWTPKWVVEHGALLHFCGKKKPWQSKHLDNFGLLYAHYDHKRKLFGNFK